MSRSHYIFLTWSALSALLSCRMRPPSEVKIAPEISSVNGPRVAFDIEINSAEFAAATFSRSVTSGDLELWTMDDDAGLTQKISPRLAPFTLNQSNDIPRGHLATSDPGVKASVVGDSLKLTNITGSGSANDIPIHAIGSHKLIKINDLSSGFFRTCPTDFYSAGGTLIPALRKSSGGASITIEPAGGSEDSTEVKSLEFRADGITWSIECFYDIAWSDTPQTKVLANLSFEFSLNANKILFPAAVADAKYESIAASTLDTDRDGKGTRYGTCSNQNSADVPVIRWSPHRDKIVVDDVQDFAGGSLNISDEGRWLQEGLKIAAADMRLKVPGLGRKLVLRSEQPTLSGDISFATSETGKTSPLTINVRDNDKGEIRQTFLPIGAESNIKGMPMMLKGFEALGLIEHAEKSYKDAYLITVLHDLGHALGLRHNLSGYGTNNNWGNDLEAVMSFPMAGIPMDFLTDKVEWKPHDILSLKILYADLSPDVLREKDALVKEVLQYPLSGTEDDNVRPKKLIDRQLAAAINYLEVTNNPRITLFRTEHADWRAQIKSIYANAYGVELP